jgi:hypothetical protein
VWKKKYIRGKESDHVHWSMNPNEREGTEVVKEQKEFKNIMEVVR